MDMNFYGRARPLEGDEIAYYAKKNNIPLENFEAVFRKESNAKFYMTDKRLPILFEAHKFSKFTGGKFDETHPNLSSATWNIELYGPGGAHQYERLEDAMKLDKIAALKSCSWGAFQIMGFNYLECGYPDVVTMVESFMYSASNQVAAFVTFLKNKKLIQALRDWDTEKFAYYYNGPQYRKNQYAYKLDQIRTDLMNNILRLGSTGQKVTALQKALNLQGAGIKVDGQFGNSTFEAVKKFQEENDLIVDGIVGAQTWSLLTLKRGEKTSVVQSKRVKGAIITGTTGIGISAEAIPNLIAGLNKFKDVAKAASETTKTVQDFPINDLIQQQQIMSILLTIAGIILIASAGYFIWTKFHDRKKEGGSI